MKDLLNLVLLYSGFILIAELVFFLIRSRYEWV